MSFHSWLQHIRSALTLCRSKQRRGSHRAATHRPNLEALEDRLTPSFNWAEFPVGPGPQALATGDFNNDGNVDLVTANLVGDTVSVLLSDGLGGFDTALQSAAGPRPLSLAVADFNNDGKLDLAVITQTTADQDS